MLKTPFGIIRIFADGEEVEYRLMPHASHSPLAGCWRIYADGAGEREFRCVLEGSTGGKVSTGEAYLAVEFVRGSCILTLGAESDSDTFSAAAKPDGIAVTFYEPAAQVVFGVAWAEDYAGGGDVRTWLAADPTL